MKANKVTVTIVVEGLSVDILRHMAGLAIERIQSEIVAGRLDCADGDSVRWEVETEPVEF